MIFQECVISDCGEIPEGEDDGFVVDDGTGDKYADFPSDSGIDFLSVSDGWTYLGLCLSSRILGCRAAESQLQKQSNTDSQLLNSANYWLTNHCTH